MITIRLSVPKHLTLIFWLGAAAILFFRSAEASQISYPFCDSLEDTASGYWIFDPPWAYDTIQAHTGLRSITESPGTSYENNVNISATLSSGINLVTADMPVLSFWHRYALESNKDYGYIDVSTDGGTSWATIYFVTGFSTDWTEEKINLSDYALLSDVRIRFRLKTDNENRFDGWYIDDVCIQETANPTIAYPFFDDMEDTAVTNANWLSSSWELVSEAHSGGRAWHDSPEGNLPGISPSPYLNTSLTQAGTINLLGAVNPQLTFWHHYAGANGADYFYVEVSENNGHTWTIKASFTASQTGWTPWQVDLSEYIGLEVRIRFRTRARSTTYDGWYIDDVRIKEAPCDVELKQPTNVTLHGADLCWTRATCAGDEFLRYELYRDAYPGVDRFDAMVNSTSDINDTCFSDTYCLLDPNAYSYKVYVVDTTGMYSVGLTPERPAFYTIPLVSYPFCDSMESGTGNWDWCSSWGLTTQYAHSGSDSWTESPGTAYQNNVNTALETSVNLVTADMPVLSFWHRYALESNKDYGYIDVSTDGGAIWRTIYFVTGFSTVWTEEKIDLSEYALQSDVRIRFRLKTDNQNRYDGWYIDDVCIRETDNPSIAYPFFDDLEDTAVTNANWLSSSWELVSEAHSGVRAWHDSPEGNLPGISPSPYLNTSLTEAGTINLLGAVNPQLTFWHHYAGANGADYFYVEVSENNGHTWTIEAYFTGSQPDWIRSLPVDLSEYIGLEVRIRFRTRARSTTYDGWYIDDVRIKDSLPEVDWCNLESPDSISMSVGALTPPIYGLVYEPGITDLPGQGAGVEAQLGYGPDGTLPWQDTSLWSWVTGVYESDVDSMDQYMGVLTVVSEGIYDYAYRYRLSSGYWTYADLDGNDQGSADSNGYSPSQAGHLAVSGEPRIYVRPAEFNVPVQLDSTFSDTLHIRNEGDGALVFEILEAVGGGPQTTLSGVEKSGGISYRPLSDLAIKEKFIFHDVKRTNTAPGIAGISEMDRIMAVDVPWVTENPTSGMVLPGESIEVVVTFDAGAVERGSYDAYLVIMSNDLDSDLIVVELHLSVNPPGPFSLLAPDEGDTIALPYVTLWQSAVDPDPGDTVQYDLWMSLEPAFTDTIIRLQGLPDSLVEISNLSQDSTWYWKVRAYDQLDAERWSNETWSFTVSPCACDCHADPACDGQTDVFDIVHAIDVGFRNKPDIPDSNVLCPRNTTDVDCDGDTDVFDVVRFVNVAFRNLLPGGNFCDPCAP